MATLSSLTVNDTGSLTLPSGTVAQRPSNSSTIVQWTNTGSQSYSFLSGSGTATNTSWTCPSGVTSIEVLVVAGGGGGGSGLASGGGAGGLIYNTNFPVTPGTVYTVTVGAGGAGGASGGNSAGAQGSNSVFGTLTAIGGGGGSGEGSNTTNGSTCGTTGGSGGGVSSASGAAPLISTTLAGTAGQGHRGGAGFYSATYGYPQGSGGGAGGPGELNLIGGYSKAGPGVLVSITGTPTWYAGGGGGSGYNNLGTAPGPAPGGIGGGGAGGASVNSGNGVAGTAGTASTGGGGGGGGEGANGNQAGGVGGSGVVVIRYIQNNSLNAIGQTRVSTASSNVETLSSTGAWTIPVGKERPLPIGLVLNLDAAKYVSGSTWQDISGFNNHGTLNNTTYTSSTYGGYFTFNGTSSYVDFGGSNYILPGITDDATATEFTINTWVSWNAFGGGSNDELISWWQSGTNSYLDGFLGTSTGGVVRFGDDWPSAGAFRFNTTRDLGKWFNITAVKTADNAYIYINGQLAASKGSSLSWGFNAPPMIGRHASGTEYFNGKMGVMQIYNRALRSEEILYNYNEYKGRYQNSPVQSPFINLNKFSLPSESNIVMHLDVGNPASYTGPGSSIIYDLAGRAHCTLVNSPTWTNDGGGSLVFNGTNQKGTFPNITIPTTTEATGFIWFRTTSTSTYQNIFDTSDNQGGTRFYIYAGVLGASFNHSNSPTTTNFSANTWYCVAASNAPGQGKMYLNGVLVSSNGFGMATTTGLNLGHAGNEARLGQVDGDRASEYFTGQFGMMAFYNRELSSADIMQIFQATRGRFGV